MYVWLSDHGLLGVKVSADPGTCVCLYCYDYFRKRAQFRKNCGKLEDAMRDILEAMFYLNLFLKTDAAVKCPFPEQTDCGKFKALYKILKEYYDAWTQPGGR